MFNRKAKPATNEDLEHMGQVKMVGCICCRMNLERCEGLSPTYLPVEFNHHIHAGRRIGRTVGTGECTWHHRGEPRSGWVKAAMITAYGPARNYQGGKGNFAAHYGTDVELRDYQAALMAVRRNVLA